MGSPLDRYKDAIKVSCPTCLAPENRECITATLGIPMIKPHKERVDHLLEKFPEYMRKPDRFWTKFK